jgi:hypothetical protein
VFQRIVTNTPVWVWPLLFALVGIGLHQTRDRRVTASRTLILGIFSVKYAVGVALAMRPALGADDLFAAFASGSYGAFSGAFIGRAARLRKLRNFRTG